MDGRHSPEAAASAIRPHKQSPNHGMRSASHGQAFALPSAPHDPSASSSGPASGASGDGTKARKGSIRNAVRRIFGRRYRKSIPQHPHASSSAAQGISTRHTHYRSEPPALPLQPELPETQGEQSAVPRAMSDSHPTHSHKHSTSLSRTGSPYAVQFPNSVRLKPMDLGNPFMKETQLRRRRTLPSMLIEREEGAAVVAGAPDEPANTTLATNIDSSPEVPPIPRGTPNSIKKSRRKSRSVDDFSASITLQQGATRKRSEEIRYWRGSLPPDVLRASGFVARPGSSRDGAPPGSLCRSTRAGSIQEQGVDGTRIPAARGTNDASAAEDGTLKSPPPGASGQALSVQESEYRPSSGVGTEMSRDLEDRVAKLEAGLHTFQRSLQKLTAKRNRRTVVMRSSIATKRSSCDSRTPSLLADTLADALDPACYEYEYEYGHTLRPSTLPQPPPPIPPHVQGLDDDPFGHDLPQPLPGVPSTRSAKPPSPTAITQETMAAVVGPETRGPKEHTPQPYTFRSLYQMLADERSARRNLESQLQALRRDMSELHSQVNLSSRVHSARSSYLLAGASTRLQDMLRETGELSGPEGSPRSFPSPRVSAASASPHVVRRPSGSEGDHVPSEEEEEEEEEEKKKKKQKKDDHEYPPPREERGRCNLAETLEKESEMF